MLLFIGVGSFAFRLYRVTRQTERVDTAIPHAMHRVDETAARVRDSIGSRISHNS